MNKQRTHAKRWCTIDSMDLPPMAFIQTRRGAQVEYGGDTMTVIGAPGLDSLTLRSKQGHIIVAPIASLVEEKAGKPIEPVVVDARRLAKVEAYKAALLPLIQRGRQTRAEVLAAGAKLGIAVSTTYAAIARFNLTQDVNTLPPPTHPGGRGKSRIPAKAEEIIQKTIEEVLLTRRQRRMKFFLDTVTKTLAKAGFQVSEATLRQRVKAIEPYKWRSTRKGYSEAKRTLSAIKGEAPETQQPLDVVQLDHWKVDVEVLSDDRLSVIGRAWLTLAIDVHTRGVWGWHLSLDGPGTTSTASCMIRGMTRKDKILKDLELTASMPFYGTPRKLHLDNAKEFRGNTLAAGCAQHNITLKFRPVGEPQYGAHIERLNGTLAQKMKDLPGATGSNVTERRNLRPEMTAALTFDELHAQLVMIFNEYHNTPHAALGCTPLEKWTSHFFGPEGQRRPMPSIVIDDFELRVSWYQIVRRRLERYGIQVDYLKYYSEELDYLIENRDAYKNLEIRRNPLDVREIYVLHPERNVWLTVGCRDYLFPVASIIELREAKREARKQKLKPTSENLSRIIAEREAHAEAAERKTKKAQRMATTKINNEKLRRATPSRSSGSADVELLSADPPTAVKPPPRFKSVPATTPDENEAFENAQALAASMSDEDIDAYLGAA